MCDAKGSAKPCIRIDNSRVRVTEWRFAKRGDNTGWHRHEFDYVVVPLFDGVLEIAHPDGSRTEAVMRHGVPYFRQAGVEHDVINGNDFACAFVETELLEDAPAS
ncbi:cupin domain-containing protein [Leisingera sp. JC11]|uniref:cupin domain-containing protein n=1 Tax=Leisingera sp. JC11 TaxID=3042469 RepID=UPI0034565DC5